ncbi:MAG TPA: cbb3-type cytochrome oxidase assembly protein CcoS [Bacteroidales bacterium]|nr:MAG: cytochrome oxidase maturation protein, cbb3-type [Bacteroidetes bacterium GWE2_42_24]OFY27497.1 MAG: cytochrome oxidase maturation protein, cbb3-type [Bacteroidetes bacterium GWF2_43_11]HAQ65138.1 cbb3-type cytochrome oxidase assembly protein CcoS [Bacteroidales bacterium]HBZ66018.1 cbb3-type cytochrome oxidase assembly protein CcoS [Bacteroidales bacterium]
MKVILILVAASLLVASGFLVAFLWAVRNGQYDDDYTPSVRILFDDDKTPGDDNPADTPEPEPLVDIDDN